MADPALQIPRMTVAEYLERERDASMKHEFVDGVMYAMAGTSRRHNTVALDMRGVLRSRLASPCEIYALDVKVEVKALDKERFFYPDVLVTCSEIDSDPQIVRQPVLIIEIMSERTRDYDRGEKFAAYRLLSSLAEYALIEQDERRLELFRKRTDWRSEVYRDHDVVQFESIDVSLPVSAIF